MPISSKKCSRCGEVKPLTQFVNNKYQPDGKGAYCKECNRIVSREYQYKTRGSKPMNDNKECSLYLGVHIAERVLSNVFKHTKRMPSNNPGYDFICGRGYKIDVKSSTITSQNRWVFSIKHNYKPDYFLLIAFNSREQLEPQHIWLIPGNVINNRTGISISERSINKWSEYELKDKLDQVIACCYIMKESR